MQFNSYIMMTCFSLQSLIFPPPLSFSCSPLKTVKIQKIANNEPTHSLWSSLEVMLWVPAIRGQMGGDLRKDTQTLELSSQRGQSVSLCCCHNCWFVYFIYIPIAFIGFWYCLFVFLLNYFIILNVFNCSSVFHFLMFLIIFNVHYFEDLIRWKGRIKCFK